MVHLAFLIGELTCAIAAGGIHHGGRHDLGVASLVGLGQEEVDECSLQLCSLADVDREASAGDLHAQVEVDEVVFLGEFPVGQTCLLHYGIGGPVAHGVRAVALLEVGFHDDIVLRSSSFWHLVVGDIGNLIELLVESLLSLVHTAAFFLLSASN